MTCTPETLSPAYAGRDLVKCRRMEKAKVKLSETRNWQVLDLCAVVQHSTPDYFTESGRNIETPCRFKLKPCSSSGIMIDSRAGLPQDQIVDQCLSCA